MERVLNKVDHLLSSLRDECYTSAVNSVQSLVQKDLGHTTMMTKINQEIARQRNKVNHLTLGNRYILSNQSFQFFLFSSQ